MSLVTGTLTPDGAVVDLLVGVSANRRQRLVSVGFAVPTPVALRAQIDTGSFVTGMLPAVFDQLGIQPFRVVAVRTPSTTPGNPFHCEQFDVSLALVSGMDRVELPSVWVIASPDFQPHEGVQAIIGRDVLDRCVFTYAGPHRSFTLAF
jgi:hypothetical protein